MTKNILPPSADVVLVSDIHMKHPGDERGQLLLQIIESALKQRPQHFILLGDIFEFCLGSTKYFKEKFAPIGAALERLAAQGTSVTFFEGNHEFELPKLGWKGVHFVGEGTKEFILRPGLQIRAAHGDLVHSTFGYRIFRGFLKSWFVRFVCTHIVPSRLLDAYALAHAKVSRASDSYRTLRHQALLHDVSVWMGQAAIGLIGHFHTPYYEAINENQILISVRDWSMPNFLVIRDSEILRGFANGSGWQVDTAQKTEFMLAD